MSKQAKKSDIHPIVGVPIERIPRHIAIIMDGNGRWAQQRGLERVEGHRNGSKAVRATTTESARIGIECLTLYSFSTENWKRPKEEIEVLMGLYRDYLINERPTIMDSNIRVHHLGQEEGLPDYLLEELHKTVEMSKDNKGLTLCLALNYSGRSEQVRAFRKIAEQVKDGRLEVDDIDEALISDSLDTAGLPDPDLLIRTSGEMRISNYLLWQISYAELYVTDAHWPDFTPEELYTAIRAYSNRNRRFGGLSSAKEEASL